MPAGDPPAPAPPPGDVPGAVWMDVAGRRLFGVWRRPPRAGRPVLVFLHDGLGGVDALGTFPARLGEAMSLPVFCYDRLGYGRSDEVARFPDDFMGAAADMLDQVLDAAGIEDCCLVGHSDGGTVALLHGARRRGRVRAIAAIAAHVRRDRLTLGQVRRHAAMAERGDVPGWMTRFHGDRAARLLRCWTEAWQRALYDTWDIGGEIAAIEAPLLALQGADDAYGLPDQLDGIRAAVPRAETELMPGVGHFPQIEDPEGLAARLKAFLEPRCGEASAPSRSRM